MLVRLRRAEQRDLDAVQTVARVGSLGRWATSLYPLVVQHSIEFQRCFGSVDILEKRQRCFRRYRLKLSPSSARHFSV